MMRVYEIFIPELGTYIKFKSLLPEDIKAFVDEASNLDEDEFKRLVLESLVYNLKTDILELIRKMSPAGQKDALYALYNGCVMLNPGIDPDLWVRVAYTTYGIDMLPIQASNSPNVDGKEKQDVRRKRISKVKFNNLQNYLESKIIGQNEAIKVLCNTLKRSQVGLSDDHRPLGVFLFAGSSGVGKTHLAKELHSYLFGDGYEMVRVDCGEYQHKHDNQKLIGSPPGYVGHEDGGQLTNQIFENSNTVVLLDEVEKAHPDIFNTFLRIFDEGMVTDSRGRVVSFRNAIVIMTTNLGNDKVVASLLDRGVGFNSRLDPVRNIKTLPERTQVERFALDEIRKMFKPEFLNRIDQTIIFNHLKHDDFAKIAELELQLLDHKLTKKGIIFNWDDSVVEALIEEGVDAISGARGISQVRRDKIETVIADEILSQKTVTKGTVFNLFHIDGEFTVRKVPPMKELGSSSS